jgi:hypothetical protein
MPLSNAVKTNEKGFKVQGTRSRESIWTCGNERKYQPLHTVMTWVKAGIWRKLARRRVPNLKLPRPQIPLDPPLKEGNCAGKAFPNGDPGLDRSETSASTWTGHKFGPRLSGPSICNGQDVLLRICIRRVKGKRWERGIVLDFEGLLDCQDQAKDLLDRKVVRDHTKAA